MYVCTEFHYAFWRIFFTHLKSDQPYICYKAGSANARLNVPVLRYTDEAKFSKRTNKRRNGQMGMAKST